MIGRLIAGLAALAALAGCDPIADQAAQPSQPAGVVPIGSGFDFYVLALSWSPGYCASLGDRANRQQCAGDQRFGFVVHGLWPQFAQGWPEFCETSEPLTVDRSTSDGMLDIMPSTGLIRHQWKKHGSCSGLNQSDYFAATRLAYGRVTVPDAYRARDTIASVDPEAIEAAFMAANDALQADAIAVTCDRRFLRDVRICLSRDLTRFRACPEVDRRACNLPSVVVPPDA